MKPRMHSNPLGMSQNCLEIYLLLKESVKQWVHTGLITSPRPEGLGIEHDTERVSDLRNKHGMVIESDRNEHLRLIREPQMNPEQIKFIWEEALIRGYMSLASRAKAKLLGDEFTQQVGKALL